jgi:hypothetical protein
MAGAGGQEACFEEKSMSGLYRAEFDFAMALATVSWSN